MMPRTAATDQQMMKLAREVVAASSREDHAIALGALLALTAGMIGFDLGREGLLHILANVTEKIGQASPERPLL